MRELDHHLYQVNGVHYYCGWAKVPNTKLKIRVRFSLGTKNIHKARSERDAILKNPKADLRFDKALQNLKALKRAYQLSEGEPDKLNEYLQKRNRDTVERWTADFMKEINKFEEVHPTTYGAYERSLSSLGYFIEDSKFEGLELTRGDAEKYRDALFQSSPKKWYEPGGLTPNNKKLKTLSVKTAKGVIGNLSTFYEWLTAHNVVQRNPWRKLPLPKKSYSKKRIKFSVEMADQLCSMECPSNIHPLEWKAGIELGRYVGGRLAEICGLEGKSVNLTARIPYATFLTQKQAEKEYRDIPIHPKALFYLAKLIDLRGKGWLFTTTGKYIRKRKTSNGLIQRTIFGSYLSKAFCTKAKELFPLLKLDFHSWRKYTSSELMNAGVGDDARRKIIGHKNDSVSEAYNDLELDFAYECILNIR